MSTSTTMIAFLAGFGRSGSTLLERMLGCARGVFPAGELRHIWERGFKENQLCSCGAPFRECEFWRPVAQQAFGEREIDGKRIAAVGREVVKRRYLPQLLVPGLRTPRFAALLSSYTEMLLPLYRAIAAASGCPTIVDSSKDPAYATILRTLPGFDLAVVHLVRDSRAVAFSWQRRRLRPEVTGRQEYMVRIKPEGTAVAWDLRNLASETIGRSGSRYLRVCYEDLVAAPADVLARVLGTLGHRAESPLADGGRVPLPELYHTVSGNPIRFKHELEIKPDVEWSSSMDRRSRYAVTLLTLPFLVRYRYVLGGGPAARR